MLCVYLNELQKNHSTLVSIRLYFAVADGVFRWKTPSGTSMGMLVRETDMIDSMSGLTVSGSLRYSFIKSRMFSLTSCSVLPCVAISSVGQDAMNHLPSLPTNIGNGICTSFMIQIIRKKVF